MCIHVVFFLAREYAEGGGVLYLLSRRVIYVQYVACDPVHVDGVARSSTNVSS